MTKDLQLAIVAGILSLAGVIIGALMTPITQLFIERKREQRNGSRAKLLVAGELLQLQILFGRFSKGKDGPLEDWPAIENVNEYVPTSTWENNKSLIVDMVHEELYNQLVMIYVQIGLEKEHFILIKKITGPPPQLSTDQAETCKGIFIKLGYLRRQLGGGGGFKAELEAAINSK